MAYIAQAREILRASWCHQHSDFVDPQNPNHVALLMDVPDMDDFTAAMQTEASAEAMAHDGVLPETLVILIELSPRPQFPHPSVAVSHDPAYRRRSTLPIWPSWTDHGWMDRYEPLRVIVPGLCAFSSTSSSDSQAELTSSKVTRRIGASK